MKFKVGLTGGIAEGKSTVLGYLRDAGYRTLSADEVAREALGNSSVLASVREAAGLPVGFTPSELRDVIVSSPLRRRRVNAVFHPVIVRTLLASEADFIEVPLLIESAMQRFFEEVWVVSCGPEEQESRLRQRYGDQPWTAELRRTQLPTRVKEAFANVILRTNEPEVNVKRMTLGHASRVLSSAVAPQVE